MHVDGHKDHNDIFSVLAETGLAGKKRNCGAIRQANKALVGPFVPRHHQQYIAGSVMKTDDPPTRINGCEKKKCCLSLFSLSTQM
jgi:hypothetical protein